LRRLVENRSALTWMFDGLEVSGACFTMMSLQRQWEGI
jgi:hypothetical protein